MNQNTLKNVNNCWKAKTTFFLETSGGQNSNIYFRVVDLTSITEYKTYKTAQNVFVVNAMAK